MFLFCTILVLWIAIWDLELFSRRDADEKKILDKINKPEFELPTFPSEVDVGTYIKLLAPVTPHLSEEIWELLGNKTSVFEEIIRFIRCYGKNSRNGNV